MPAAFVVFARQPLLQAALACLGAAAFFIYARSWRDAAHLVYDVPASLATFSFIAQLVLEAAQRSFGWFWAGRAAVVVVLTVVTTGRQYGGWSVSGHLTCVLAIALIQSADARLPAWERLLYWVPVPIVLAVRWVDFDHGQHAPTYAAIAVGLSCALLAVLAGRLGGEAGARRRAQDMK